MLIVSHWCLCSNCACCSDCPEINPTLELLLVTVEQITFFHVLNSSTFLWPCFRVVMWQPKEVLGNAPTRPHMPVEMLHDCMQNVLTVCCIYNLYLAVAFSLGFYLFFFFSEHWQETHLGCISWKWGLVCLLTDP